MVYLGNFSIRHGITELYIAQLIRGMGHSVVSIFIPIYLLELGYQFQQIFLFFLLHYAFFALAAPFAAQLASNVGFKKTTLVRIPFYIASFLLLYGLSSPTANVHYLLPAALYGISKALYWIPMNTLFFHYSNKEDRGKQVGVMKGVSAFAQSTMPAIGGIIAAVMGTPALIIIALFMICLATVPLFLTEDRKPASPFSYKDLVRFKREDLFLPTIADGFAFAAAVVLFPLLIFTTLGKTSHATIGYIFTLGTIVHGLASVLIGTFVKAADRAWWMRFGFITFGLTLFLRAFLTTVEAFAALIVFGALSASIMSTMYDSRMYDSALALKKYGDEFIVAREIMVNLGRMSLFAILLLITAGKNVGWHWGFVIAAAVTVFAGVTMNNKPLHNDHKAQS